MEAIFEIMLLLIFRYPGAALRWLFSRLWKSKKKYIEFLEDNVESNAIIFIGTLILVTLLVKFVLF
ncbi:hypothetical protein [Aurantibacter sp.]|uniref:hypothetical protein n=1 Tax=Aurantibacter sp. TaxID=2807103 RepID=UPI0035C83434